MEPQPFVPSPTPPPYTPSDTARLSHKPLILFLIVLLLVVVGAMGIYGYKAYRTPIQQTVLPTPVPKPTRELVSLDTSDWVHGKYLNISFKYPSYLKPLELLGEETLALSFTNLTPDTEILFVAYDNPNKLSVKEFNNEFGKGGIDPHFYSETAEQRMVNGVIGYYQQSNSCDPLRCDIFTFVYQDKLYKISNVYGLDENNNPKNQKEIFDQILSTFTFIE